MLLYRLTPHRQPRAGYSNKLISEVQLASSSLGRAHLINNASRFLPLSALAHGASPGQAEGSELVGVITEVLPSPGSAALFHQLRPHISSPL